MMTGKPGKTPSDMKVADDEYRGIQPSGFGVYIHWPFCHKKCPYCDFNSHVRDQIDQSGFGNAIITELKTMAEISGFHGKPLDSVFFGGGTPSLMEAEIAGRILNTITSLFSVSEQCEITLEANPTFIEADRLQAFRDQGINRLSLGIQSLKDDQLAFLGRQHSAAEASEALAKAQHIFPRVSADFIYALPDQKLDEWQQQLSQILDLGCDHLSLYQLTLEQGTAFYSLAKRGRLTMLDETMALDQFLLTQEMCESRGMSAYEVSNHATPGQESRHNLIYWRGGDWLGAGPGAIGRFWHPENRQRVETRARKDPDGWREDVSRQGHGLSHHQGEDVTDYASEAVMMGLRLREGIRLNKIESLAGPRSEWLDEDEVGYLCDQGLLSFHDDCLTLTDDGKTVMNTVIGRILK